MLGKKLLWKPRNPPKRAEAARLASAEAAADALIADVFLRIDWIVKRHLKDREYACFGP